MNPSKDRASAKVEAICTPETAAYLDNKIGCVGHYTSLRLLPIARLIVDPTFDLEAFDPFISIVIENLANWRDLNVHTLAACCTKEKFLKPQSTPNHYADSHDYPRVAETYIAEGLTLRHTSDIRSDVAYNHARYTLNALRVLKLVTVTMRTEEIVMYPETSKEWTYQSRKLVYHATPELIALAFRIRFPIKKVA